MNRRHPASCLAHPRSRRARSSLTAAVALVTLVACTDSPGPAPRASSRVAPITGGCNTGPYLIPANGTPTTETTVGTRVEDGKSGADVSCSVRQSGSGYSIRGSIKQGSSFFVTGQVAQTGEGTYSGTGSITFYAPAADTVTSNTCSITVSAVQEIGDGKVWASASCTDSRQGSSAGRSCDFGASFILENCES